VIGARRARSQSSRASRKSSPLPTSFLTDRQDMVESDNSLDGPSGARLVALDAVMRYRPSERIIHDENRTSALRTRARTRVRLPCKRCHEFSPCLHCDFHHATVLPSVFVNVIVPFDLLATIAPRFAAGKRARGPAAFCISRARDSRSPLARKSSRTAFRAELPTFCAYARLIEDH